MILSCFRHEGSHFLMSLLGALNIQSRGGFIMNFMQTMTALKIFFANTEPMRTKTDVRMRCCHDSPLCQRTQRGCSHNLFRVRTRRNKVLEEADELVVLDDSVIPSDLLELGLLILLQLCAVMLWNSCTECLKLQKKRRRWTNHACQS